MKNFHPPIIEFMNHYAAVTESATVQGILDKRSVDSEAEARAMLEFLDLMCSRVAEDTKRGVVVGNQRVVTSDAEKVCEAVESYLEELGYDDLMSDDT